MNTPVVLIHWDDPTYYNCAIKQAEHWGNHVVGILDHYDIAYSMELDRWLILKNYMRSSGYDRLVYIDSDVLLYTNVSPDFMDCDIALSRSHSGHTIFINNYHALEDFCDFAVMNHDDTELVTRTRRRIPEGVFANSVGDMVLWNNFMFCSDYMFCDVTKPQHGAMYDHNINTDGIVRFYDGIPYRGDFRMKSLHFQGDAKRWMKGSMND